MTERIERILIANRGECARGIAFTCKRLEITPVVVYTPDDEKSLHVKEAGKEAHKIPSYTDIESIIKAACESQVQAIHPGWGFVSEDPKFAKACEKKGIIFIGPQESAIRKAGNKETIKRIATNLGVPVITSTPPSLRVSRVAGWAKRNGLSNEPDSVPMMLKAATAGGGSGNQVIRRLEDLDKAVTDVIQRTEKLKGSSRRVFMERFLADVRHVEVQVLGDQHKNLVHLGTRDCSVQYNQQKIIEEAPAPFLSQDQQELLYSYALELAKAIEYSSAGTVEFLVEPNGNSFFMEFNPRLQVEHGVTELITGLDLVEQQIRIAEGKKLTKDVKNPKFSGVAIEARVNSQRIYKQDPQRFTLIPSGGKVEQVIFPEGKDIRVDHCLYDGYTINPNYNPTQAKVMVLSSSRDGAIDDLRRALKEFEIKGVETNIPFIIGALSHSKFVKGEHTTGFSQELLEELARKEGGDYHNREIAAAIGVSLVLAFRDKQNQDRQNGVSKNATVWKIAGRIAQMEERRLASRNWRR